MRKRHGRWLIWTVMAGVLCSGAAAKAGGIPPVVRGATAILLRPEPGELVFTI